MRESFGFPGEGPQMFRDLYFDHDPNYSWIDSPEMFWFARKLARNVSEFVF